MSGLNVHFYPSPFTHETRMLKISHSLVEHGVFDEIHLVALWKPGLPEHEQLDESRHVWRIRLREGRIGAGRLGKWIEWLVRGFWRFRGCSLACVNPHSVASLPVGAWLKRATGCRLVYDTHELETETAALSGPRKRLMKELERRYLPRCDAVSVVSEGIADWYAAHGVSNSLWTIRNFPPARHTTPARDGRLRRHCGIGDHELLFLYQGLLTRGRGLELLLRVFSTQPMSRHLVCLGYGPLENLIKKEAARHANIHFHPAVPPEDVLTWTTGADVGLSLIENVCLSYYHSLPNKLFEYVNAGVPPLVSAFPEMSALVSKYHCGWTCPPEQVRLQRVIGAIDRASLSQKQQGVRDCAADCTWESQESELLSMYQSLDLCEGPAVR